MTKQYKGRTATIEIDEKNVIIKSSGFFSSSKKTIPLRDIKNVELSASSFFSKDTVEIYYGSNVEKVQFSNSADAKMTTCQLILNILFIELVVPGEMSTRSTWNNCGDNWS